MTEPMIDPLFAEYTIAKRNVVITSDMPSVTFLVGYLLDMPPLS